MKLHVDGASSPKGLRDDTVAAERGRFGGIKFGSAFFGWMTATGISVLLTALTAAIVAAVRAANDVAPSTVTNQAAQNLQTVNVVGGIILAVILFISYYCGGYVAGRMARFDGANQGLAVWLWAVAALAGSQFNNLLNTTALPGLPANDQAVTAGSITVLIIAALVTFAGAVLGGLMGMRFHRKVDQTGVDHPHWSGEVSSARPFNVTAAALT